MARIAAPGTLMAPGAIRSVREHAGQTRGDVMNRRNALKGFAGGGAGLAAVVAGGGEAFFNLFGKVAPLEAAQSTVTRGLPALKITDVKVILTEVGGNRHCNVKVLTSEPGLYGVGC